MPGLLRSRFSWTSLFFILVLGSENLVHAQHQNVDDLIETSFTGLRFNRRGGTFSSTGTLTNISNIPVSGPLQLVITQTDPSSVTLANTSGTTQDGLAYVEVALAEDPLPPGGQIANVVVQFRNPTRRAFTFATSVLGVPGSGAPPSPLEVEITSPDHLSLFNSSAISVSGTVDDPTATVTVNGINASGGGGSFAVLVPLSEGNLRWTPFSGPKWGVAKVEPAELNTSWS